MGVQFTKYSATQFLTQSQEVFDMERVQHVSPGLSGYIAPYHFTIPRWVVVGDSVPDQCLSLPPSLQGGRTLPGTEEPEVYAQPNISYHLCAFVRFRVSEDLPVQYLEAYQKIEVIPYTEMLPPTDIRDFPVEYIESTTHSFRTSIFGRTICTIALSMHEPPAIQLGKIPHNGTTEVKIDVEVQIKKGKLDTTGVQQLLQKLQSVQFKGDTIIRAKTFYSTVPFSKLPGQTMLTARGQMRLNDAVHKIETTSPTPPPMAIPCQQRRDIRSRD